MLEGAELAWLDFNEYGLSDEAVDEILLKKARSEFEKLGYFEETPNLSALKR